MKYFPAGRSIKDVEGGEGEDVEGEDVEGRMRMLMVLLAWLDALARHSLRPRYARAPLAQASLNLSILVPFAASRGEFCIVHNRKAAM